MGVVAIREAEYQEGSEISELAATDTCEISRLYVHPQCRRLGIATRLMDEVEESALDMGYQKLKVTFWSFFKPTNIPNTLNCHIRKIRLINIGKSNNE